MFAHQLWNPINYKVKSKEKDLYLPLLQSGFTYIEKMSSKRINSIFVCVSIIFVPLPVHQVLPHALFHQIVTMTYVVINSSSIRKRLKLTFA